MTIVKRIFIGLVILLALPLIVALFVKKEYSVEREIVINKPKREVFDYLKYLRNQANFSTWAKMDPTMKYEYRGADGWAGFIAYWDGDEKTVGQGEQEIANIIQGERIDYKLLFVKPFPSVCTTYMTIERVSEDQTKVKWGMNGSMSYPMNLMQLFMNMDDMVGTEYEKSLSVLKDILEDNNVVQY